ncbi:MAG: hypothetical protein IJO86_00800 [Oscillospiraceae bacterium]|nr:hypothetical protein [Oscillospiraceae bacterium]
MEVYERLAILEANDTNIFHQLTEIKTDVRDIRRLINAVETIAVKTESIDSKVDNMGDRLLQLENKPIEDLSHYKRLVIGSLITAVLSTVVTAVLALILR